MTLLLPIGPEIFGREFSWSYNPNIRPPSSFEYPALLYLVEGHRRGREEPGAPLYQGHPEHPNHEWDNQHER